MTPGGPTHRGSGHRPRVLQRLVVGAAWLLSACLAGDSPLPEPPPPPIGAASLAPALTGGRTPLEMTWLEPAGDTRKTPVVLYSRLETTGGRRLWSPPSTVVTGADLFVNWADFPSVTRTAAGTLLAHWLQRSDKGTYSYDVQLARSTDQGASWKPLGPLHADGTASEHGFVSAVPEGDGVRVFWLDGRQTVPGSRREKDGPAPAVTAEGEHGSRDPGDGTPERGAMSLRTARVGTLISDRRLLDDRVCDCCQTAAVMTAAGPLVAYRDRSAAEIRDISIIRATPDGWSAPVPIHADGWKVPGCPVNGPAVAADAGDPSRVAVAWFTAAHNEPAVNIAFSTDSGEHFGPPVRVDDGRPIGRVSVRIDTGGDAIVAWIEATPDGPAPGAALRARRVQAAPGAEPTAGPAVEIAQVSPSRASGFPRLALEADRLIAAWTDVIRDTTGRSGRDVTRIAFSTLPLDDLHGPGPETSPAARHAVDEGPAENGAAGPGPWSGSPDSPAPRYVATTLDGEQLALADLRGQPVLVNVWATWCAPCREEMGDLASLHERFAPGGLAIVGINVDVASNRKRVDEFLARERTPYRILLDPDDRASRIFGLRSLPASFLFDAKGRLIWRRIGVIHAGETELNEILTRVTARDRSS